MLNAMFFYNVIGNQAKHVNKYSLKKLSTNVLYIPHVAYSLQARLRGAESEGRGDGGGGMRFQQFYNTGLNQYKYLRDGEGIVIPVIPQVAVQLEQ